MQARAAPLVSCLDLRLFVHELRLDARHVDIALHHLRIVVRRSPPWHARLLHLRQRLFRCRQCLPCTVTAGEGWNIIIHV